MQPEPRKRKILYVITRSNFGGAQRYVYNLATALPKDHFTVKVATGKSGILTEKLQSAGIEIISLPSLNQSRTVISDILTFSALFSLIKLFFSEQPHTIHLNSSKAGGLGALAGRIAGVKNIIFTAHGWPTREKRSPFVRFLIIFFSWLTAVFAHRIIAVSEADFREASSWPFMKKKLVMIHNGLVPFTLLKREVAQQKLHIGHPRFIQAGTNAELHPNKNLAGALEAVAEYNRHTHEPLEYTIIGEGEERSNLEKLIERLGAQEFIHLAGFKENAPDLLSAFDLFILPSYKEGLPFALLEAGYAKLPVIATKTGGIPEIVDDGETGLLIDPPSPYHIHKALEAITTPLRVDFGIALKKKIEREFMFPRMLERTMKLYREP